MSTEYTPIKTGELKWDTGIGGQPAATERNFQNLARVQNEWSHGWRRSSTDSKVAFVAGMISVASGLIAIGNSYSSNKPCESACIIWSVVSGLSGIVSLIFCCCSDSSD